MTTPKSARKLDSSRRVQTGCYHLSGFPWALHRTELEICLSQLIDALSVIRCRLGPLYGFGSQRGCRSGSVRSMRLLVCLAFTVSQILFDFVNDNHGLHLYICYQPLVLYIILEISSGQVVTKLREKHYEPQY